jgi:hypothetical protein
MSNEIDLDSNRKCAEVLYIKSLKNFWVRLEEHKNEYFTMIEQLQDDYQNAHQL